MDSHVKCLEQGWLEESFNKLWTTSLLQGDKTQKANSGGWAARPLSSTCLTVIATMFLRPSPPQPPGRLLPAPHLEKVCSPLLPLLLQGNKCPQPTSKWIQRPHPSPTSKCIRRSHPCPINQQANRYTARPLLPLLCLWAIKTDTTRYPESTLPNYQEVSPLY